MPKSSICLPTHVAYFAAILKKDLAMSEVIMASLFFCNVFGSRDVAQSLPTIVALSNLGEIMETPFPQCVEEK